MKKLTKGFTMIELLIVIAVLGVLAIAVLSAINPIEQINRGRDTGSRSDAEQLLSAVDRFNAAQGYWPWALSPTNPVPPQSIAWTLVTAVTDGSDDILTKLSTGTEEIKSSFVERISATGYNPLWLYFDDSVSGASAYICFMPQSGSFKEEAETRCGGTLPGDFPSSACSNTTNCGAEGNCICLP